MPSALKSAVSHQLLAASLLLIVFSFFLTSTSAFAAALPWDAKDQSTWTLGNLIESANTGISGLCTKKTATIEVFNRDKNAREMLSCDDKKIEKSGGVIGYTTGAMTALYHPPTSSVYYLANLGENLGLGPKTAYAQVPGSGSSIIQPVMALWQVVRNITYIIFIFIFLVVGFMIMFRQKINPQTVIGVQQALPSLVVGLILVTFSYFIAALIVDLAFVGIQLVVQIFTQPGLPTNSLGDPDKLRGHAQNANIFWLYMASAFNFENIKTLWAGTSGQLYATLGGLEISSIAAAVVTGISAFFIGPFSLLAGAATLGAIPVLIPAIVVLVLLVALFIQMFKLLFALISAYITILIMTFAGPFFILAGSIPGRGGAISNWLKNLIANTLIFPAVFAAFLFAGFILGQPTWSNSTLPLFGGVDGNFIRVLIAYGILLGAPGIPQAVKGAFGVKDQNPITQAAMGGMMGGVNVAKAGANKGTSYWREEAQAYSKASTAARAGAGTPPTVGYKRWMRLFGVGPY